MPTQIVFIRDGAPDSALDKLEREEKGIRAACTDRDPNCSVQLLFALAIKRHDMFAYSTVKTERNELVEKRVTPGVRIIETVTRQNNQFFIFGRYLKLGVGRYVLVSFKFPSFFFFFIILISQAYVILGHQE
jgi:hypothetical protein